MGGNQHSFAAGCCYCVVDCVIIIRYEFDSKSFFVSLQRYVFIFDMSHNRKFPSVHSCPSDYDGCG